jgi:elongator complex protein 1
LDPKEYLPFLNELRKLPLLYCRFKIDKYLKRYDKALNSISQMPDKFDECLEFVKEHKLYKNALKIYDRKSHEHHMISLSYGEYLSQREFYKESGLIYQACGELSLASAAFEKANQWELVLSISSQLGHSEEQIQDTARRISSHLKSRGEHATAADVLLEYSQVK